MTTCSMCLEGLKEITSMPDEGLTPTTHDVADMFEFLKQIYTNPNEVREAKDAYADLRQGSTLFPQFKV